MRAPIEQMRLIPARDPGAILEKAFTDHQPSKAFILVSGGKDSTVTADVLLRSHRDLISGIVHIDTGIAVASTSAFVREFAASHRVGYTQVRTPIDYDAWVLENGFPGPAKHGEIYNLLKLRAIEKLVRENKRDRNDRVMLITGVRAEESARRGQTSRDIARKGAQLWVAPLIDWSARALYDHRTFYSVPMSPSSQALHMSGDSLCGAMVDDSTHRTEWGLLQAFDPVNGERLCRLEKILTDRGDPRCRWGVKIPGDELVVEPGTEALPLCVGCGRSPFLPESEAAA